jgi:hypothetical protein
MRFPTCIAVLLALLAGPVAAQGPAAPQGPGAGAGPGPARKGPPRTESAPPLTLAAWKPDHDKIQALLDAGEDPNGAGTAGLTPWMFSLIAGDRTGFRMLFDAVRDFRPADFSTAIVFLFQVVGDDRELVGEMLKRGVSPDLQANDGTTALMLAAASGRAEMIQLLLDAGAQVNRTDRHGDTALMSAVRAGSVESIRKLLARGAQVDQADKAGNRAMTYALRTARSDVQQLLREAGARAPTAVAPPAAPGDPRTAVARSLPLLERASKEWLDSRGCNACHMQPVMLRVNAVARARGFAVDPAMLGALESSVQEDFGPHFARMAEKAVKTEEGVAVASLYVGGDQAFSLANSFAGALDAGLPRHRFDRASVRLLARMQQPDGSWRHGPDRVPMQSGDIPSTAMAARVLKAYAAEVGPASRREFAGRVERAQAWLVARAPKNSDDAAFKLLGLRWLGADQALVSQAAAALASRQLPGGGWAQLDGLNPDAYATGQALVALAEGSGMRGSDPVYRRGMGYLLSTQDPDGSWLVHKRSVPVNRYFESGFPHGKFQFTSFLGTAWAAMALMYGQPDASTSEPRKAPAGGRAGVRAGLPARPPS